MRAVRRDSLLWLCEGGYAGAAEGGMNKLYVVSVQLMIDGVGRE